MALLAALRGRLGTALAVPGGLARIDVRVLLQDASHGVLGGANPYTMAFPAVPAGQTATCFTYLPGSFLLVIPGRLLGDVRVALAAAFSFPGWCWPAARCGACGAADAWASAVAPVVLAPCCPRRCGCCSSRGPTACWSVSSSSR